MFVDDGLLIRLKFCSYESSRALSISPKEELYTDAWLSNVAPAWTICCVTCSSKRTSNTDCPVIWKYGECVGSKKNSAFSSSPWGRGSKWLCENTAPQTVHVPENAAARSVPRVVYTTGNEGRFLETRIILVNSNV